MIAAPVDAPALRAQFEALARPFGAVVRVADARADATTRERMEAAFTRGDFATWNYDAAYARAAADPRTVLPGARSVVCVAVPYATERPRSTDPLVGRVSNYAWSRDYHDTVRGLARAMAACIERVAGPGTAKATCDTAPLAERAFAARAGAGWIGKHTNLIVPELGSFVFLGEAVTSVALPADPPLRRSCGACRRCIDVCPTGALRGDTTIDATRCISDLTQRTDAIPRALRPLIGTWVWGCDLCNDVCPPTVRAGTSASLVFGPAQRDTALPPLLRLLTLRSGEYKRLFKGNGAGWRGAAVLRRNAAVALGNALDRAAVPSLARACTLDPHPLVRGHAAWALGRIRSPRALAVLEGRIRRERDPEVDDELAWALEPMRTARV